jgi:hypothetical protein
LIGQLALVFFSDINDEVSCVSVYCTAIDPQQVMVSAARFTNGVPADFKL